ncbi:5-(carboxyamino)imidazole ribonucleotide synthase [Brunnivagina elsteri]|uniref:N5-carboxyaminoimidazole ribonucleotide synthase n=1 Tax=Brunnivagina elsteri CCALA 953 TaxID=987040 RepID=A0A2A2TDF9_9CYAN|nr:5-(carboxyamino)imidazole ribonucleotide synthase [Calothrix elsteri]PAX51772.1 5-(carboxyamino)imidazole ribonucleotide synthase [Calothrix elsteri CCALA 953]
MKRVGVIGGGQLAWMMGSAAKKLGIELVVQTPSVNDPAVVAAKQQHPMDSTKLDSMSSFFVQARVDDAIATGELAKKSDVITFENEFVDLEALSSLAERGVCFRPRLEALAPLLDKYHQRCYLRDIGIPVPNFVALDLKQNANDLHIFSKFGFPVVLKARRHGYDGQGTYIIKDIQHLESTLEDIKRGRFKASHVEFLLEEFIPFTHELAVIAARSVSGEVVNYPVVETQQQEQVCRRAIAPANISPQVAATIENISRILLNSLDAIGVFGIELFLTADDKVLVNEIAPRTHNSGHFSLDACQTSQFEQHLRAICGLPLGNPSLICPGAVMVNLLGYENSISDYQEKRQLIEAIPNARLHWYGKSESRPGRKLGHVTVLLENPSRDCALEVAQQVESIWYPTQT